MNSFQFNIFKEITRTNKGKNIMVSPLSIYHILSLTANGAENNTLKEMLKALVHKGKEDMNKNNKLLSSTIEKFNSVELANAVFTKFKPENSFTDIIKEYKAKIDLLKDAAQVNKWCNDATHGKISKILDSLGPNDLMVLINAIYFKGIWKYTFDKNKNTKNAFMNFNKEPKTVEYMNITQTFSYLDNEDVQAVSLKYQKDSLSALIILPKKETDINNYIQAFTFEKYDFILKNSFENKINLILPKFEIKFEDELKPNLISLGMNDAFTDKANFSGMSKSQRLYIGKVIHKTFIKVDEEGTEAAAVTAVVMRKKCISITPTMEVNRPFLFIIRGENLSSGHDILFASKVEYL